MELSEKTISEIEERVKNGSAFSRDELYEVAWKMEENKLERKLEDEKRLKKQNKDREYEKLKYDILHNIDNYKDYKICPSCRGTRGIEVGVQCSYDDMDYYSDGDYYYVGFEDCSKCDGLGYIKKGNKNGN